MPVINVNSCKHILTQLFKPEGFSKCCLRICTLPIKQNIYVSIAACMQMSSRHVTANDKRNDMFRSNLSFSQLPPLGSDIRKVKNRCICLGRKEIAVLFELCSRHLTVRSLAESSQAANH